MLTAIPSPLQKTYRPEEAAVAFYRGFRRIARRMAPNDRAMQDDLTQEMALGALQAGRPGPRRFFLVLAVWRAKDFLRRFGESAGGTLEDILRRAEEDFVRREEARDGSPDRAFGAAPAPPARIFSQEIRTMNRSRIDLHGERLARLEAQLDHLVLVAARTHADLHEHLTWQRRLHEQHAERLGAVERDAVRTRAHLGWMKAIWLAMQGVVLGWLGMK